MDAATVISVIRVLEAAVSAASAVGANVSALTAKIEQARAEGRQLTDAEIREFADSAQAAIDRL